MTLTLVLAVLSGQVIYEWVDAKGQSHFTDDRSTIPKGVKPRETKGAEVSVVRASPPAQATDAGVEKSEETVSAEDEEAEGEKKDPCSVAQGELTRAEERMTAAKEAQGKLEEELTTRCQLSLLTHGQGTFAQCMAGRSEAITRDHSALEQQVEVARETLRLARAQGCR